jgi:hypothetical protein
MFSYEEVKQNPKLFMAMTGLTYTEYEELFPYFQKAWHQYVQKEYVERPDRIRHYGGGRDESTLVDIHDKLLFILYYIKVYPLQEIIAYEFGMSQGAANVWIHVMSSVLIKTLDEGGNLPERNPQELQAFLASEADRRYAIDGTERRIQRPKDDEVQEQYYSGKKKPTRSKISSLAQLAIKRFNT